MTRAKSSRSLEAGSARRGRASPRRAPLIHARAAALLRQLLEVLRAAAATPDQAVKVVAAEEHDVVRDSVRTVAVVGRSPSSDISPNTSPAPSFATAFSRPVGSLCRISTSPSRMTNSPWPASPSRMITVPGSRSCPSKRLSSSICCWWSNGLNSGDVASRFLSSRSRAKRSRRSASDRHLVAQARHRDAIDLEQVGLAHDLDGRGTRLLGDQRHLAEQRALVQAPAFDRLVVAGARHHAHLAARDEVERGAELAFADHHVAVAGAHQAQRRDRRREQLARQLRKERHRQELLRVLDERGQVAGARVRARPRWRAGSAAAGRTGSISRVQVDRRLPRRELRQRRRAVRVGRRHHRDDVAVSCAQRLQHLAAHDRRAADGPSARRASPPRGRRRRRPARSPEREQQVRDLAPAVVVERVDRQHVVVRGQRRRVLLGPGQRPGLGLQVAQLDRHADFIRAPTLAGA